MAWTQYRDKLPDHGREHFKRNCQGTIYRIYPETWAKYCALYGPFTCGEWTYDTPEGEIY